MKNAIQILFILLAVQGLLTILTFSGGSYLESYSATDSLFDFTIDEIDQIVITPGKDEENKDIVTLSKKDNTWLLADHFDFPVAKSKIESINNKLLSLKRPLPVGSTSIAAKQFQTTEDTYKTKVEFKMNSELLKTLYLGSAPTFKKVHAKFQSEPSTYSLSYSGFSLQGKPSAWIDRKYLSTDIDQIAKIEFPSFTLLHDSSQEQVVTISELQEDEEVDQKKALALLKNAASPLYLELLGKTSQPEYQLTPAETEYTIYFTGGEKRTVQIGKVQDKDYFVLKASDKPYYFKSSDYHVEKFKDAKRGSLVNKIEMTEESVEKEDPLSDNETSNTTEVNEENPIQGVQLQEDLNN